LLQGEVVGGEQADRLRGDRDDGGGQVGGRISSCTAARRRRDLSLHALDNYTALKTTWINYR
jgi:hypothetical protein